MPRPRKSQRFGSFFGNLETVDLKQLKKELSTEIKIRENASQRARVYEDAKKVRDKICIGDIITYGKRTNGGLEITAQVVGIFAEKVQVIVDGRKRSVSITKILSQS